MVEPFRSPMDVKDLLSLLETVKQSGNGWTARCPAHDDRKPSLSVGVGTDGRILVHCHAGCEIEAICRELEIEQRDLFPATTDHGHSPRQEPSVVYDYDNLFQVLRYPGKKFLQRRPDGNDGWIWDTQGVKPRLYHLNDLAGHKQVIVAEGEKDVDRLRQLGLAATCNSGGAGKWQAAHAEQLRGVEVQRVVVIPDGDDAGRKHGLTVARTCAAAGLTVNIVNLPDDAKDVSEFLGGSRDRAALIKCIDAAAVYSPETEAAGELPDGWVFLSDVEATAELGPPVVARGLAWAGRVSLLHSREKVGKSTITTAMTAAVTRGKSFLEQPTRQGPVVWFSEEHPADVRKRLEQWGADCSCVAFGGRLDKSPESPASLKSLVTQIKPVLVIVDTLTKWAGALGIRDLHGAGELGQRLAELVTLARESDAAILILHHNRKNPSASAETGDTWGEYRDSTAIGAAADMIVSLSPWSEPQTRRLTLKGRWSEPPLTVTLGAKGYALQPDIADGTESATTTATRPLEDSVRLHLLRCEPDARPSRTDIRHALHCQGRRYAQLMEALDTLLDKGEIDHAKRTKRRGEGYALTETGRPIAEALGSRCSVVPTPGVKEEHIAEAGSCSANGNRCGTSPEHVSDQSSPAGPEQLAERIDDDGDNDEYRVD